MYDEETQNGYPIPLGQMHKEILVDCGWGYCRYVPSLSSVELQGTPKKEGSAWVFKATIFAMWLTRLVTACASSPYQLPLCMAEQ
jgi:hypothetical protein